MALIFAVGTRVLCKLGEWRAGTILNLNCREDAWPLGMIVPHEVELDDNEYSQTYGWRIHATDDNSAFRLASFPPLVYYKAPEFSTWVSIVIAGFDEEDAIAAMDAIYGFSWSDQLMEERRCECDSSVDRNLKEFHEYWLRYHLPVQDIIQAWDLLPVFVPEPIAEAAAVQSGIPGTAQQPRQELQKEPQEPRKEKPFQQKPQKEPQEPRKE